MKSYSKKMKSRIAGQAESNKEGCCYGLTKKQLKYVPMKRVLDIVLCLPVCILLSPVMIGIAIAIKLDSPGPVLFKQKRFGKDKTYFKIWKFRTMRVDTPKDMPTHLLKNPEKYITHIGSFMRLHSIDELPQLYQCLLTNSLSLCGPRPALWNQSDLVAERDKYGANSIKPGITGWAQINGRDELEIPDKARLDGKYVKNFGLCMDIKCLFGTIGSVLKHNGVVEGGTGITHRGIKEISETALIRKKKVVIGQADAVTYDIKADISGEVTDSEMTDSEMTDSEVADSGMTDGEVTDGEVADSEVTVTSGKRFVQSKKILITGAHSYIGMSVERWLENSPEKYAIETLDMIDDNWKKKDFSEYDVVYHVAGIAHADTGHVTAEQKKLYYRVNRDLAVETAEKAKAEGVKQFIFMSSMIVYSGCEEKIITKDINPNPLNFYGDSKWQADQSIRKLADEKFKVAVVRPPMIYGRGSKGNYSALAKLAVRMPVFPIVINKRSMLHIDNLCQFVKLLIDDGAEGIFFPQNHEYVNTSDMVQMIAKVRGHKIIMIPFMSLPVKLISRVPGKVGTLATKAFGDSAYEMGMSEYKEDYRVNTFRESIELTES